MTEHHQKTPHHEEVKSDQKIDFNNIVKQVKEADLKALLLKSLDLVLLNPVLIIGLGLVPVLVSAILDTYLFPQIYTLSLFSGGLGITLIILIQMAISVGVWLLSVGLVNQAIYQAEHKTTDLNKIINFIKTHFVSGLALAWDVLLYTQGWMIALYYLVASILVSGGLLGMASLISLGTLLFVLAPFVSIVYFIIYFKKLVACTFAFVNFFYTDKPSVKHALEHSQHLVSGRIWTVFGNVLIVGFIVGIVTAIISAILSPIFAPFGWAGSYRGLGIIPALVSGAGSVYTIAFLISFKQSLEKKA